MAVFLRNQPDVQDRAHLMKQGCRGYLVLRKPECNFDEHGRGAFLPDAPRIGDVFYGGVDRMAWFDIDEDYYAGELPRELIDLRKRIQQNVCGLKYADSLQVAEELLRYSNRTDQRNELVLATHAKLTEEWNNGNWELIGCDLHCDGYGSILREGLFSNPDVFSQFSPELNDNGLFRCDTSQIRRYITAYKREALRGAAEPIAGTISVVHVYRRKSKNC